MTCLNEAQLIEAHYGDGTAAGREHVASCVTCARRAAALARDLGHIDAVLGSTPPARRVRRRVPAWRWAPLAVAALLALAVAIERPQRTPTIDPYDDTLALADELVRTIAVDTPFDDAASSYDDEAPSDGTAASSTCTWGDPLLGVGCDEPAVMQIAWR